MLLHYPKFSRAILFATLTRRNNEINRKIQGGVWSKGDVKKEKRKWAVDIVGNLSSNRATLS